MNVIVKCETRRVFMGQITTKRNGLESPRDLTTLRPKYSISSNGQRSIKVVQKGNRRSFPYRALYFMSKTQ